jgi:hypothetical protein
VHTSTDGKVRAADIEYKLPGESVFRTTTRPIHKLVLVVPIEEQVPAVDQAGREGAEPGQAAPLVEKCLYRHVQKRPELHRWPHQL